MHHKADSPKVVAVILSFGQCEFTLACLESLFLLSDPLATIIVCDNNSSTQTQQAIVAWGKEQFGHKQVGRLDHALNGLSTEHSKFVFIQNGNNLGFAAGNNSGIRYALHSGADYIWLLNNDTTVHPAALGHLSSGRAESKKIGIAGSTVVFADDKTTVQCAGGCAYNPFTTIFKPALGGAKLEEVVKCNAPPRLDYIYGAALFVKREVFEKCGLLNEKLFLFNEEIDLCMRAKQAGFDLEWCRDSIVYHKGSQTVGQPGSGDKVKISFANYHENVSTLIFSKRFYPAYLPFILLFRFFGKMAMLAGRGEWYLVRPLVAAYKDFFGGRNQRDRYEP